MKAFLVVFSDFSDSPDFEPAVFAAKSAANAKYKAALDLFELGYVKSVFEAMTKTRCRRCKEFDYWANQIRQIPCNGSSPNSIKTVQRALGINS